MDKYKVTLKYIYSAIIEVEAETEEEAITIAREQLDKQGDSFQDSEVEEL